MHFTGCGYHMIHLLVVLLSELTALESLELKKSISSASLVEANIFGLILIFSLFSLYVVRPNILSSIGERVLDVFFILFWQFDMISTWGGFFGPKIGQFGFFVWKWAWVGLIGPDN